MNSETTCGLKNSYIEAYLGEKEAARSIPVWERTETRSKLSFNPFAFLFSFFWCFHKRMYREFAAFLAAFLILPVIVGGIAGISKMEGDISPKAVYSELRRIPVSIWREYHTHEYAALRTSESCHNPAKYMPWYEVMLTPLTDGRYSFEINSEPAFYYGLFRILTVFAVNLVCGFSFNYLYMKSVRRSIIKQLTKIKTDSADVREKILRKAAGERSVPLYKNAAVFLFFAAALVLPVFYDTVCIVYPIWII